MSNTSRQHNCRPQQQQQKELPLDIYIHISKFLQVEYFKSGLLQAFKDYGYDLEEMQELDYKV